MAKFPRISKLTIQERQRLLLALCEALASLQKKEEAAQFLIDLLSSQELEMIAKRLEIAKLLIDGKTYDQIRTALKASYNTIARVNAWLAVSGQGFRIIIERTKKKPRTKIYEHSIEEKFDSNSWYNIKRRHSMYFWPELLIEELIKKSDEKKQKRLTTILSSIENKREIFEIIDKEYKEIYKPKKKNSIIVQEEKAEESRKD